MKTAIAIILCSLLAAPAFSAIITTQHFGTQAEVDAHVIGGYEFFGRGDTEKLRITRTDPPAMAELPFPLWNNGVPHAFKVVYNLNGIAGISIDDLYTIQEPVSIREDTNGLLITALAARQGGSVLLSNLNITLPNFTIHPVGDTAAAPNTDYMLVTTDLPLAGGFILNGTVTFSWAGTMPPPIDQWFEVAPVVTPEPAAGVLVTAGLLLAGRRRRSC
jgi:hypothetical protein